MVSGAGLWFCPHDQPERKHMEFCGNCHRSRSPTWSRVQILKATLSGPNIITGGSFGPEASIVALTLGAILSAFYLWKIWKNNFLTSPFVPMSCYIREHIQEEQNV